VTNFLSAAFVKERLTEVRDGLVYLHYLVHLGDEERERLQDEWRRKGKPRSLHQEMDATLHKLISSCEETCQFMEGLPSDPILYTGGGSTQQVIDMLEQLILETYSTSTPAQDGAP